jgi:hypothetical protein
MSDRFAAPSRAERRFGRGVCLSCKASFIRHRHAQRYCSESCRKTGFVKRHGRLSTDPRYVHRRAVRAARGVDLRGRGGNRSSAPEFVNEINDLQGAKSRSTRLVPRLSWPIDLIGGGSRRPGALDGLPPGLAGAIVVAELGGVPLVNCASVKGGDFNG